MKKVFLLLNALLFTISGVWATEVTTVSTAGTPLTLAQLKALSGTGGHVAFANLGSGGWTNKWLANPSANSDLNLSKVQLYTITDGSVSGKYYMQCVNDSKYRTGSGWGDQASAENIEFIVYDPTLPNHGNTNVPCDNPIQILNNSGTPWNINYGGFGGLPNAWSAFAAYGPIYIVTVNCEDESGNSLQTETHIALDGTEVNTAAPDIEGYRLSSGSTPNTPITTIDGADVVITYTYEEKWPVNFDRNDTFTRTDRKTTYVKLGDETINFTGQSTTPCKIYNDETTQHFTQPVAATVTPTFGFTGHAMMGYVYIDYNNDGDFSDDGELVSRWNDGYQSDQLQNHNKQTPAFTLTTTPGSYRARFKVDWDNTDPGGNGSSIADNGGAVIDVTIDVKNYYEPTTNKFYRLHIGDKYMCNVADGNVRTATTTNDDASTIFYLNASNYLIAYADGFGFNYSYCKASGTGIFNSFSFLESTVADSYFIHANPGTESNEYSSRYITINGSNKLDEGRGAWTIEVVDALPVTISAAGYATLYAPVALTIPNDVEVYTASDKGAYLRLDEIEGQTIPANTGVILKGNAGTYNFEITDDVSPISSALTGSVSSIGRPVNSYILATGKAGVAFYQDGASTIPGFKAYLPASSGGGGVKAFVFDTDGINGLTSNPSQMGEGSIFNLAGQRLSQPMKGVNIINGKKYVIK